MFRSTRWIAPAALGAALALAAGILLTRPVTGHGDPDDALRVLIRATGMLSAVLFGLALAFRDDARSRDACRGVLASHLVHGAALAGAGLLWNADRLGDVARQSHVVFALFPDWTPMVLGGLGYIALFVLALAPRPLSGVVRIGAEAWLLSLFVSFYLDASLSRAARQPVAALAFAALALGLVGIAVRRWRRPVPAAAPRSAFG